MTEPALPVDSETRQSRILAIARVEGRADVAALAEQFGVATETIRRDLKVLAERRLVKRVHGGAIPLESAAFESDFGFRSQVDLLQKQRIAHHAVGLLHGAETVFLDEGFTPRLVAELLADRTLTVVTASLLVAQALAESSTVTVFLLGGKLRGRTLATVDSWALRQLAELRIDLAFMGTNGITATDGLTTPDPAVAAVKRLAVERSRRSVLMATDAKFGVTTFIRFAEVADFETIVTGTELAESDAARYTALGTRVVRV
ncbi:DeoR/GlpR family DNA-binding transcription regulator [Nocardioides fonticola]|uniref:Lactose phosphotransferase system repressor n=1 Tax=Nocardioides fonticola TaxID=450363 RepID=A0ABP7XG70_9ACTN